MRRLWAALGRLADWLFADSDEMWRDANVALVYLENQRRLETGCRPIRRDDG